jgi:hypothetical protein
VVVIPSTGTIVGDGVGGIGVSVAEGMAVGGSVTVIMKGVAVPEPAVENCHAQPARSIAMTTNK